MDDEQTAVTEMTSISEITMLAGRKVGAFGGVFAPMVLSILGVILYLRVPWVVGNAGLGGALLMLAMALVITVCTGLSLSTIASNTRVGEGGTFGVLSRSLGFEVGAAIGVPLLLTRPLVVAMNVFGFREGLLWIAPELPPFAVDLVVFGVLFAIAYRGATLAFYLQSVVLLVIGASLLAIVLGDPPGAAAEGTAAVTSVTWWGQFPGTVEGGRNGTTFWAVFAVLFPAMTGFLAGAPAAVDIRDPRRNVPQGTLFAIGLSTVVYVAIMVWCARAGTEDELVRNYTFVVDGAASPLLVVIGLLCASATSALAGLVDAPRILTSLGNNRIVPYADAMSETVDGEPRNAMVVTGMLTLACLLLRDIQAVAPLLTMLFLATYALINLSLLVESQLQLITFRPTLRLSPWVPVVGLVASLAAMFLASPILALVIVAAGLVLVVLIRRYGTPVDDETRSGLFLAAAEWVASRIEVEDFENPRAWRPNLLVPVIDAEQLRDSYRLLMAMARPEGSIRLMGLATDRRIDDLRRKLERLGRSLGQRDLRTTWSMIDLDDYESALHVGAVALQGAFLRPNAMFLRLGAERGAKKRVVVALRVAQELKLGVVLYAPDEAGLGNSRTVRVWVRRGPGGWDPYHAFDRTHLHLALLLSIRLVRQWQGQLELATIASTEAERGYATEFLDAIADMARVPASATRHVFVGDEEDCMGQAGRADLTVLSFARGRPDVAWIERMMERAGGSCLFTIDSGIESAIV